MTVRKYRGHQWLEQLRIRCGPMELWGCPSPVISSNPCVYIKDEGGELTENTVSIFWELLLISGQGCGNKGKLGSIQ